MRKLSDDWYLAMFRDPDSIVGPGEDMIRFGELVLELAAALKAKDYERIGEVQRQIIELGRDDAPAPATKVLA